MRIPSKRGICLREHHVYMYEREKNYEGARSNTVESIGEEPYNPL